MWRVLTGFTNGPAYRLYTVPVFLRRQMVENENEKTAEGSCYEPWRDEKPLNTCSMKKALFYVKVTADIPDGETREWCKRPYSLHRLQY